MITERVSFKTEDDLTIVGLLTQHDEELCHCVIIVHGNASNKERSSATDIAIELSRRGVDNLRIDLDGCGESEGLFEDQTFTRTVHDVDAAILFLATKGYKKISLYGASAGGCTVLAVAINHPEIFRLGCKSPTSDYPAIKLARWGHKYIDDWRRNGFAIHQHSDGRSLKINYTWWEDAQNYIMCNKAHMIIVPTLIVHGNKDTQVPLEQSQRMAKLMPNVNLFVLDGADHDGQINGTRLYCMRIFGDWFEKGVLPPWFDKGFQFS